MNSRFFSLVFSLLLAVSSALYAESFCGDLAQIRPRLNRDGTQNLLVLVNYEGRDTSDTAWDDRKLMVEDKELIQAIEWKLRLNFSDYLEDSSGLRRQNIQVCLKEYRQSLTKDRDELFQVASNPQVLLLKRRGETVYRGETSKLTRVVALLRERDDLRSGIERNQDEIRRLEENLRRDRERLESVLRDLEELEREEPRDEERRNPRDH